MILTCEKCDTSFSFDENLIKSSGSKVRCSKCRHIFVVVPPTSFAEAEPDVPSELSLSGKTSVAGAAGLDDLDLDAIEKSLDLDPNLAPEEETAAVGVPEDAGLILDFEDDDFVAAVNGDEASLESTDELDFDLDLDFDADADANTGEANLAAEATETMDFQLDLDLDDEPAVAERAVGDDDLNFDLDGDLDETSEGVGALTGDDTTDDLEFQLDLDLDDEVAGQTGPEAPVAGLDFDQDEKSVVADSGVEFDETQELDLSDMDSLLDLGHKGAEEAVSDEATESLDIDLDFGQEAGAQVDGDQEDFGSDSGGEDLEFELDLDPIEAADAPDNKADELESTDELDLADLEEMIESEEGDALQTGDDSTVDELDLEIDRDTDIVEGNIENAAAEETEITDDFDLTGLDDLLELDDDPGKSNDQADVEVSSANKGLDLGSGDGSDESDVTLDDMLDIEVEELVPSEAADDDVGDFDLVLDDDLESGSGTEIGDAGEDEDEDDFDLSDLDDMLEIEDSPETEVTDEEEEFDLDLDFGEVTTAGNTGEANLEFEVEEEEVTDNNVAEVAAVAATATATAAASGSDGFGMGTMAETDDEAGEAEDDMPARVGQDRDTTPTKAKKKRGGGLMKTLLVLVLLIGGAYGGYVGAQYFGIDIPYLDRVKDLNIPYVSDMLGAKAQDVGNLKINIIEKDVDGHFVSDTKEGLLYVVSGKVKNDYDHPRSFIQITGKLYSKGRKLQLEKTVYAGNVLSDAELVGLDKAGIDKKMGNRMGQDRSNFNLKKGAVLPFMIVFSNLPKDPDEYTVEVAGSVKAKK